MMARPDNRRFLFRLALGTVVMAVVMAVLLVMQLTQKQVIGQGAEMRADSITALVFQFEREFLRFRHVLDSTVNGRIKPDPEVLNLRHEILISRLVLLRENPSTTILLERPEYISTLPQLDKLINQTDGILAKTPPDVKALAVLLDEFVAIGPQVQALSLAADTLVSGEVERQKTTLLAQNDQIVWLILAQLILLLAAAAGLLARQRRQEQERIALEKLTLDLRDAKFEAEAADRGKTQFLANMSHELRTPFNGILGMLSLLEDTALKPQQADYIKTVRNSANHLLALLNDILDVSALEAGKMTIKTTPVHMPDLLRDVEALMRPLATGKNIGFSMASPVSLPPWVMVDGTRLKQILFNLISNGIKFTPQGGVTLTVRVAPGLDGVYGLTFVVQDTGIGMDAHALSRLFERFYQVDGGVARKHGGTGLGLEISRSLARLMGGDIEVNSAAGIGSIFTLHLPLPVGATPSDSRLAPTAALTPLADGEPAVTQIAKTIDLMSLPEGPATPRSPRVLVVEDHPVNQKFVGVLLNRMGCEVTFCEDGQMALNALQRQTFDVILMDINMPVMDGLTATRAIRALTGAVSHTPIVVMTADVMNEARENAMVAGANDFLVKPVQIGQFKETMQTYLDSAQPA